VGQYNPIELANNIYNKVCRTIGNIELRRYFRFRGGRWYGGIATADVIGCNLMCRFCWSWRFRNNFRLGYFCGPDEVFDNLVRIARKHRYRYVRLSGAEPTISRNHLLKLLKMFNDTDLVFILETNGILIGYDDSYAKDLARFSNLVVRVSFKGTSPDEFGLLTGAGPEYFEFQFRALENLINAGLKSGKDLYAAAMIGFSDDNSVANFVRKLSMLDPNLIDVDWEYVILYPHVEELLNKHGLKPLRSVRPNEIPRSMV